MSRFSGRQKKGALREYKAEKKAVISDMLTTDDLEILTGGESNTSQEQAPREDEA